MLNSTNPSVAKGTVRQALEDAGVSGAMTFLGALTATSILDLPPVAAVYSALLAGLYTGVLAYARARQIQVPPKP